MIAHYFNGTSEDVTPYSAFSINNTNYFINSTNGNLVTPQVFSDESIILSIGTGWDNMYYIDLPITIEDMELSEAPR